MEPINQPNFVKELQEIIDGVFDPIKSTYAISYGLLHAYTKRYIIPLLHKNDLTIATVELTTCGLISDLLTGSSGASHIFILGMIPYSNEMKIKLGIEDEDLSFGGYGVASPETAKQLAERIREFSGANIGLAETGLISSSELEKRRTEKKAGEVYTAISFHEEVLVTRLSIQEDLKRREMRQEIAYRVLQFLGDFLKTQVTDD
ncbi:MAG: CinA family protein [Candidatus Heimdallarchaeota archaeon]|nr:MAG: CinA family protein [Candidatus Heimdallarchaeota archaeon]